LFHHFIGCPLLFKRLDVTTRMFGKLRPQGHAGKAGSVFWDDQWPRFSLQKTQGILVGLSSRVV
jgi:hypothetical protein